MRFISFNLGMLAAFGVLFTLSVILAWYVNRYKPSEFERNRGNFLLNDDFIFLHLNPKVWKRFVGYRKGELTFFANDANHSYVKDGLLHIRPDLYKGLFQERDLTGQGCKSDTENECILKLEYALTPPIESARIQTSTSFSFTYGTVEIRARMPRGDWISSKIRLLPKDDPYGVWPRSGEIVIAQVRSNDDFSCNDKHLGNRLLESTLYFGQDAAHVAWKPTHFETELPRCCSNFTSDFHVYGVKRTPDTISFFLDGKLVGAVTPPSGGFSSLGQLTENIWNAANSTKMAPFDRPFYIDISVSAGGNNFAPGCTEGKPQMPWTKNMDPINSRWDFYGSYEEWHPTWQSRNKEEIVNALQIDYIRVYEYVPDKK